MDKIEELLTRGVDKIYPSQEELEKVLRSGKKLRLYQGFDPTGERLHIGHMVGFRKLRQWQYLGHHVIFLIGDGTGQAGDPSGKLTARDKFMTREELRENAREYVMQASKIVNFKGDNPVEILYNGDWLNSLTLTDILEIAGKFSLQQLSERDLFQERIKRGETVNLREFLYPLLQGYDSVAMDVDLEIGGTDQMFNMLAGRSLMKSMRNKDKFVMTTPLLTDSEGKKIGKTEGNVIGLTDKPDELFGEIMALGDDVIVRGLEYLTDIGMDEIKKIDKEIKSGKNPIEYKKRMAFEIVKQLNDEEAAVKSEKNFGKTVQEGENPDEIKIFTFNFNNGGPNIVDILVNSKLASSNSEAKRLIEQGGVALNNEKVSNINFQISEGILRVGKRKFIKILKK